MAFIFRFDLTGRKTALHFAVRIQCVTATQILLKVLSEKNPGSLNWLNRRRGRQGLTAMHLAAKLPSTEILKLLFDAGADVSTQDAYGNTALHSAIRAYATTDSTSVFGFFLSNFG
jgi:ankyrin repeat protein